MKVAFLAPVSWRVPPRHYGPWEQFSSLLTEGLVRRGIDVTLFATADSISSARLAAVVPTGYSEDETLDARVWESLHIASLFERAAEFDLIHNSLDFLPLVFTRLVDTPVLTTIHGFASDATLPPYVAYSDRVSYVAVSEADRHPALQYVATIHHGIDMSQFQFQPESGDYLLFFGRIHPDKGTAEAIQVAQAAGIPLTIAGIIQDQSYFDREVKPHLNGDIRYIGPVGQRDRGRILGNAVALLHLINFEEPFGFSVVESMACGTPVIARSRGSMPEIVRHEENGYLVESVEEAVTAVEAAGKIDRRNVRGSVEGRFTVERMVDKYIDVYQQLLRI
jgi:glycosyltransferase involved in cell wall biosynthesis